MVHPVRARPAWTICCASDSPQWCRPIWSHTPRTRAGWGHLSPAEGAGGGPSRRHSDLSRPLWMTRINSPEHSPLLQRIIDRNLRWQPWPVEGPLADELDIHWPSDDWPPAQAAEIIEDRIPDAPPQIILWRDTGGLLDMWA